MKTCTSCHEELPLSSFSKQKTNPNKRYAWCDGCRKDNVPYVRPMREEWDILRAKAISLRKIDGEQAKQLAEKRRAGSTLKELSAEYNVSITTIQNTAKRVLSQQGRES